MGIVAQRIRAALAATVVAVVLLGLAIGLSAAGQGEPGVCSLPLAGADEPAGCL